MFYITIIILTYLILYIKSHIQNADDTELNANYVYHNFESHPSIKVQKYKLEYGKSVRFDEISIGETISYCAIDNKYNITRMSSFQVAYGYIHENGINFVKTYCFDNNEWLEVIVSRCTEYNNSIKLLPIPFDPLGGHIFVMICNIDDTTFVEEYFSELIINEYPRVQIQFLDNVYKRWPSDTLPIFNDTPHDIHNFLPFGIQFSCVSSSLGDKNITVYYDNTTQYTEVKYYPSVRTQWSKIISNNQPDYSRGQLLVLDFKEKEVTTSWESELNEYGCASTGSGSTSYDRTVIAFYIQMKYNISLDRPDTKRINLTNIVPGEKIECNVSPEDMSNFLVTYRYVWILNYAISIIINENTEKVSMLIINGTNNLIFSKSILWYSFKNLSLTLCLYKSCKNFSPLFTGKLEIESENTSKVTYTFGNSDELIITCSDKTFTFWILKCESISNCQPYPNKTIKKFDYLTELFYGYCQYGTKKYLEIKVEPKILNIELIRPRYYRIPKYHLFGYIFKCSTELKTNIQINWECVTCRDNEDYQKTQNISSNILTLTINSNDKERILHYECVLYFENHSIAESLYLHILPYASIEIHKPTIFFMPNSSIHCIANTIAGKSMYDNFIKFSEYNSILLPTKLIEYPSKKEITTLDSYYFDSITEKNSWVPKIPAHVEGNYYKACCYWIENVTDNLHCINTMDLEVALRYNLYFNFDVRSYVFFADDFCRCCVTYYNSQYSKIPIPDPKERRCLPGVIKLEATINEFKTIETIAIGRGAIIPRTYDEVDIAYTKVYATCFSGVTEAKEQDAQTRTKIRITACSRANINLEMLPLDQTKFLVNETIQCRIISHKCKDIDHFNYEISFGGKVIVDRVNHVRYLRLTTKHVGQYVRVRCEISLSNTQSHISGSLTRDITVEHYPFNIEFDGANKYITINSVIGCTSDGFPPPIVMWQQISGPEPLFIDDPFIIIRGSSDDGNYVYKCTAINKHGQNYRILRFKLVNSNNRIYILDTPFLVYFICLMTFYVFALCSVAVIGFKNYFFIDNIPWIWFAKEERMPIFAENVGEGYMNPYVFEDENMKGKNGKHESETSDFTD